MKTVIMAGGKGRRLGKLTADIPKPMVPICGIPVLEREIICLRDQGFKDIIITVGYLGEKVMEYFGDGSGISPSTNKPFGVNISYYLEKEPLGNAGALFRIRNEINDENEEDFLLLNADALFDIDFNRFVRAHKLSGTDVSLFTHPNSHPYDSGLIIADKNNTVKAWLTKEDKRPEWYHNCVNAGLHVLNKSILEEYMKSLPEKEKIIISDGGTKKNQRYIVPLGKVDLDRMLLKPLAGTQRMQIYNSPEYVKDMGTPERYLSVCKDWKSGIVQNKNLQKKQRAFFLDRDGTINKHVGFLKNIDSFELLPGVANAIRLINESGYLAIVVTNQPVVARGEVTFEELNEIHKKMETLLGLEGAYLDAIYFCPHHPHKGYEGEVIELKKECDCRKPKPGMLLQAAKEFNIDLKKSWMIGDGESDIIAGKRVESKTGFILRDNNSEMVNADLYGSSLEEIILKIFKREEDKE